MQCIGFCGAAGEGKTSVANAFQMFLLEMFDTPSNALGFADTLKAECAQASGLPLNWFYSRETKEELRPLLQVWGDMRRNPKLGGDAFHWCNKTFEEISQWQNISIALITDVRYPNEVIACRREFPEGFTLVKVDSMGTSKHATAHNGHSSEQGIPPEMISFELHDNHALSLDHPYHEAQFYFIAHNVARLRGDSCAAKAYAEKNHFYKRLCQQSGVRYNS